MSQEKQQPRRQPRQPQRAGGTQLKWVKHVRGVRVLKRGDAYQVDVGRGDHRVRVSFRRPEEVEASIQLALDESVKRRKNATISRRVRRLPSITSNVDNTVASSTPDVAHGEDQRTAGRPASRKGQRETYDWLSPSQAISAFRGYCGSLRRDGQIEEKTLQRYQSALKHVEEFIRLFALHRRYVRISELDGRFNARLQRWLKTTTGARRPYVRVTLRTLLRWAGFDRTNHRLLRGRC